MGKITSLIIDTAQELNAQQEIEISRVLNESTPLFGREGLLDSLGLVSLVVAVEQAIEDKYGVRVALADEKALSQTKSPYKDIASLANYAAAQIDGQRLNG